MDSLVDQKLQQAASLLDEFGVDVWLTFVRETAENADPVLPLILGTSLTWQSALLVTRSGERIAIVGRHEVDAVEGTGAWTNVVQYDEGLSGVLLETLDRLDPASIAINYSTDDVKADGLTHGMYLLLRQYLDGTPHNDRLVSAGKIIAALRGRKTSGEVERLRAAIRTTDEIFCKVAGFAKPGVTEREVSEFMHHEASRRGLGLAWEEAMCPIVTSGPDSMVGHAVPSSQLSLARGRLFHLDFGVEENEYCSDLQRVWYILDDGESAAPEPVLRAFDAVKGAIDAAAAVLKPGVECWRVDEAARNVIINAGYPEYKHATGHHVGRAAHDGGGVLGPRWERYGKTPYYLVEPGNVFTLELGVMNVDGRGYVGLEEMVIVTDDGCEFISNREAELWTM